MTDRRQPQDHLQSRKKLMTKTIRFIGDSEVWDAVEQARGELQSAQTLLMARQDTISTGGAELPAAMINDTKAEIERLTVKVAELEKAAQESMIELKLTALGRRRYEEIKMEHPPTDKQKDAEGSSFNPDTFPLALICESVVWIKFGGEREDMSREELTKFLGGEDWSEAEFMDMWMACVVLNQSKKVVDLPFA